MSKISYSLNHVSLIVADVEKSLEFYCRTFGLQQVDRPDFGFPGAWLQLGAQQIHLMELKNPDSVTGRPEHGGRDRHVALNVPDLSTVREILDKQGIVYTVSISGRKALFFRDPDGNAIEIIEQEF